LVLSGRGCEWCLVLSVSGGYCLKYFCRYVRAAAFIYRWGKDVIGVVGKWVALNETRRMSKETPRSKSLLYFFFSGGLVVLRENVDRSRLLLGAIVLCVDGIHTGVVVG
jgi:hypothetical protein